MPSATLVERAAKTQTVDPNRAIRIWRANNYPIQIWWMIVVVISLIAVVHWSRFLYSTIIDKRRPTPSPSPDTENAVTAQPAPKRPLLVATRNLLRIGLYRYTLPLAGEYALNVTEGFFIMGYVIALMLWCFINTENVTTHANLDVKYWSNRAGTISASQFPFLLALTMKNNAIAVLTGISYERLSFFHRTAARMQPILILVHTFGRVKLGLSGSDDPSLPYMVAGWIAMAALFLLVILSIRPIRSISYEFFRLIHILLAIIILVGTYIHCADVPPGFSAYVYPAFILWGFDRLARGFRILLAWPGPANARISIISPTVTRVDVKVPKRMRWSAGQHAFLTLPSVPGINSEAHPFSIGSLWKADGENMMTFFIKAKNGWTGRLMEYMKQQRDQGITSVAVRAIVDGPYGIVPSFRGKDCVILLAGGTGCSYTFPLLEKALQKLQHSEGSLKRVVFIWAIRNANDIKWLTEPLKQALLELSQLKSKNISTRIEIHVTDSSGDSSEEASTSSHERIGEKQEEPNGLEGCDCVKILKGRPDLPVILDEEIGANPGSNVAVFVSAPREFSSEVRASLRSTRYISRTDVALHLEYYAFA